MWVWLHLRYQLHHQHCAKGEVTSLLFCCLSAVWRRTVQRADTHCGGHWAAASNSSRRREKQEITGRYFLTDARHGGPVAALNQIRTGERYSYALTLALAAAAQQVGLRQLHIDIMCKWAVWLHRLNSNIQHLRSTGQLGADAAVLNLSDRLAQLSSSGQDICSTRLVHSAAHGSLHAQSCQVRTQVGLLLAHPESHCNTHCQLQVHLSPKRRHVACTVTDSCCHVCASTYNRM
jgi:hypothetical protein